MIDAHWLAVALLAALLAWLWRILWQRRLGLAAADRLLRRGRPELAAGVLERLRVGRPDDAALSHRLAHALYQAGRLDEALALCDGLLLSTDEALAGPLQALRADCLERLGRADEAHEAREQAGHAFLDRDPGSLFARELAIDRLQADGNWFGALHALEDLLENLTAPDVQPADPASFGAWLMALRVRLGRLYGALGFDQAAVTTLELILSRSGQPDTLRHDAYLAAGRAYLALGSLRQAERDAGDAFRIANLAHDRERLLDDCLLLAEVAVHRGDYVEAMRQYQRVRECSEAGRWLAHLGEAQLLHLWGRRREAERSGRRAADLVPADDPLGAALVATARAGMAYDHDPRTAWALLEPALAAPAPEPRFAARRAALAAMSCAAVGRDPSPFLDAVATARRAFAHDRHLQVDLDIAEGEVAWHRGDWLLASDHFGMALARPCAPLVAPHLQVRLADCLARRGRDGAVFLRLAAAHPIPLADVEEARRRLSDGGRAAEAGGSSAEAGEAGVPG